jgi:hypothetical protein
MSPNEPEEHELDSSIKALIEWFNVLDAMRACVAVQNPSGTPEVLSDFYAANLADLLVDDMHKSECRECFTDKTKIPIPDGACDGTTFKDVLDSTLGSVSDLVKGVFEATGNELGTAPATSVAIWPTCTVFPKGAEEDLICRRLADYMRGVFPVTPAKQTTIRNKLRTQGYTVQAAADDITK